MQITTFNPMILSKNADEIIKLFEELGFRRRHTKEDIGELGDILFKLVKCSCKQVTQIMRKYLVRIDVSLFAQGFHFSPDVCAVYRLA